MACSTGIEKKHMIIFLLQTLIEIGSGAEFLSVLPPLHNGTTTPMPNTLPRMNTPMHTDVMPTPAESDRLRTESGMNRTVQLIYTSQDNTPLLVSVGKTDCPDGYNVTYPPWQYTLLCARGKLAAALRGLTLGFFANAQNFGFNLTNIDKFNTRKLLDVQFFVSTNQDNKPPLVSVGKTDCPDGYNV